MKPEMDNADLVTDAPVTAAVATHTLQPSVATASPEEKPASAHSGRKEIKIFGARMPRPIENYVNDFSEDAKAIGKHWRTASIKFLPAFVVNNSSNILGLAHVGTEIAMFKASMKENDGPLIKNSKNPINWVVEPIKTVFAGVADSAKLDTLRFGGLFKGNLFKNIQNRLDTKNATILEYEAQMAKALKADAGLLKSAGHEKVKFSNRWQSRATLMGLTVWSLSALIPEKKESPEEIEQKAILRINHPVKYVGERLKEAVWFPDWAHHKRQMIGLGLFVAGFCSMVGAWRNRKTFEAGKFYEVAEHAFLPPDINAIYSGSKVMLPYKTHRYKFNREYFATGTIGFFASLPLLFSLDEKGAYSGYGWTYLLRTAFLPGSIAKKYDNREDGRGWYAGAAISFQIENLMQALWGGARKVKRTLPDGRVVEEILENKEVIQKGKAEGREIKAALKKEKQLRKGQQGDEVISDANAVFADHSPAKQLIDHELGRPELSQTLVTKDGTLLHAEHSAQAHTHPKEQAIPVSIAEIDGKPATAEGMAALIADEKKLQARKAAEKEGGHQGHASVAEMPVVGAGDAHGHALPVTHSDGAVAHGAHKAADSAAPEHRAAAESGASSGHHPSAAHSASAQKKEHAAALPSTRIEAKPEVSRAVPLTPQQVGMTG